MNLTNQPTELHFLGLTVEYGPEPSMRIIVSVKEVPNTLDVRIDPKTGDVIREGAAPNV